MTETARRPSGPYVPKSGADGGRTVTPARTPKPPASGTTEGGTATGAATAGAATAGTTGPAPGPAEGRRERKKRQTRRHICDVALALFLERGFAQVTVAEIAAAADVAVNTVYNHFPTKEDLCFPPDEDGRERLANVLRRRAVGESAADAVLGTLRRELRDRDRRIGLTEGFGRFREMIMSAPTLRARIEAMAYQIVEAMAAVLAEETGAAPGDPLPLLVAGQLGWAQEQVFRAIGLRTAAGEDPDTIAEAMLDLVDVIEDLLGERVRTYAVRGA